MKRPLILTMVLFGGLVLVSPAVCNDEVFTNPEEAGIDYRMQGEYIGQGDDRWGSQVVALGNGRFLAVGYRGGLPGDGWDGDERHTVEGRIEGEVAVFVWNGHRIETDGREMRVRDGSGGDVSTARKVDRKSPTLGAEPPEGAIVLFDGTDVQQWRNGRLVMERLLGATNAESVRRFGDHSLHLEFRTPLMPNARGQARGNSGLYVQGRYEIQILDSFALEGKDNECGGIYQIASPKVNMCLPPLAWQTYDVDFTAARYDEQGEKTANARITVRHNGVVIHEDLELPRATPGPYGEAPEPGPVFLQDHGDPVVFRNIWVVEK